MMMMMKKKKKEEDGGFTRLASFVCDCEPFVEEDLQAIEASLSNHSKKRPFNDHTPRRRLPTSLIALQHPNASSLSPHPGYSRMRLPVIKFSGRIMYSRTFDAVDKAATNLLQILEEKKREMMQIAIGFDIEWKPSFRKGIPPGKVAVMQICGDTSHCHVLHLIHSGIPHNLQLLLEDPTVLKVGAGIVGDAVKVFRDFNISVKGVMDLSFHANQKLGGDHKWGLASLTEKVLSKQVSFESSSLKTRPDMDTVTQLVHSYSDDTRWHKNKSCALLTGWLTGKLLPFECARPVPPFSDCWVLN